MSKNLQIRRNNTDGEISTQISTREEAIAKLNNFVENNEVADGEPLLMRYIPTDSEDNAYDTIVGIVCVKGDTKTLNIISNDNKMYWGEF